MAHVYYYDMIQTPYDFFTDLVTTTYAAQRYTLTLLKLWDKQTDAPLTESVLKSHIQFTHRQLQRLEELIENHDIKISSTITGHIEKEIFPSDISGWGTAQELQILQRLLERQYYELSLYSTLRELSMALGDKISSPILQMSLEELQTAIATIYKYLTLLASEDQSAATEIITYIDDKVSHIDPAPMYTPTQA